MKLVYFIVGAFFVLTPRALANIDCSRVVRLQAAELHYKAGCLLAAIRICSDEHRINDFNRSNCYQINQADCDSYSFNYRIWLQNNHK